VLFRKIQEQNPNENEFESIEANEEEPTIIEDLTDACEDKNPKITKKIAIQHL